MLHRTREKNTVALSSRLHKEDPNRNRYRFFFFELDEPLNQEDYDRVCATYRLHGCDFLIHRTGNGHHFLSVTLISREEWKEMSEELKDINPRCPQINMRWKNNKYVEEKEIWFHSAVGYCNNGNKPNSFELCHLLNKFFLSNFKGNYPTVLQFTPYEQNYETR